MNSDTRKIKRRRWAIFGVVVLCLIVSIAGFYGFRKLQYIWLIDGYKEEARTAMDAGYPVTAYHKYRGYLSRHPKDIDALIGLTEAILTIDPHQTGDPSELIYLYQQILTLSPDDLDSRLALMEVYHRINFSKEAIELAGEILEEDVSHARAYEIRSVQQARLRQFDLAIADSQQYLQYEPTNIDNRILLIHLLAQNNAPEAEVLAWGGDLSKVIEWEKTPPDYDPQSFVSALVNGFAHQMIGETQKAIGYYEQLANHDIEDPKLARLLVTLLDDVGRHDDALALLFRVTNELGLVELRTDLCRRLWEGHKPEEVLSQFGSDYAKALDQPGAYPFILYSLYASGERVAADSLVAQGRVSEYLYIETWANAFKALRDAAPTDEDRRAVLDQIRVASQRFTNDVHLRAEYANLLMASGYTEAALAKWQEVATQAPRWSEPMLGIANIFLSTRREAMAIEPAQAAIRLAPNRIHSVSTYLRAMVANPERLSTDDFNRVRALLDDVQEDARIETLIPLQIELIARSQVDDAKVKAREQLQAVVTQDVEYALGTWLSLIRTSERYELGLTPDLIEQAYEQHGNSPELALTRVISLDRTNKQVALDHFEQLRLASDEADELPWQLAKTQLELSIQPDQAVAIWQRLLDHFPGNQLVQVKILQDERNWHEDQIDLVRQVLSGTAPKAGTNEIPAIRIARARLKVMDAESEEELGEAARYALETSKAYPYLFEPYVLLGQCYEKQGRPTLALDAYQSAHKINPNSDAMLNFRVRLHRELGETEQAQALITQHLDQFANSAAADPASLARAYAKQGDLAKAKQWARRAIQQNTSDRATSLLLASLYFETGQEDEAESLYNKLMQSPDLQAVIAAASFYIRTGRPDEGTALVTGLGDHNIDPSIKAILRGQVDAETGDRDAAELRYEQIAEQYRSMIRLYIRDLIAANRMIDDLGPLQPLAVRTSAWRSFVLDMILHHKSTTYATASAWIAFAMDGLENHDSDSVAMKIKAASAWHITAMRDSASRGHDQAEAILNSLPQDPQTARYASSIRCAFALERGDFDEAVRVSRQVLSAQPENVAALNNLAMALIKLDRPKEALSFAERAANAAPVAPTLDTLALAQLAAGKTDEAELTIGRAIDLDPKNISWLITRCRILMAKDEPAAVNQALQAYEQISDMMGAADQISDSLSKEFKSLQNEMDQLLPSHQIQR